MTRRLSDDPKSLWTAFAVAWLLVLALAVFRLPGAHLSPGRLGGGTVCVASIALFYMWLTHLARRISRSKGPASDSTRRRSPRSRQWQCPYSFSGLSRRECRSGS